jgi:mono/diheme cytochrome c family protein
MNARSICRPRNLLAVACSLVLSAIALTGCQPQAPAPAVEEADLSPHVMANTPVEAGRYIVILGGCNDCHTDGYLQTEGQVPEEEWLTGSSLGWRGPWGTTYPPNLRLRVQEMDEDIFVDMLHTRTALPPMPWMNVNQINEQDARALYRYIKSLGPRGEHKPAPVAPEDEPTTPYFLLEPQEPEPPGNG